MNDFSYHLQAQVGHARAGVMQTPHGAALTPMFMPVGTRATIKALDTDDITNLHPQVILANTYHLYLRPGHELINRMGGLHQFMGFDRPMLTDSGGFQVFSLGAQQKQQGAKEQGRAELKPAVIREDGVEFTSHLDGTRHFFTPEFSIEIQQYLGADVIMAFDECVPDQADFDTTAASVDRVYRWAEQSVAAWEARARQSQQGKYQALFGIVQGALHPDLRRKALEQIQSLPFDGIAIGGETIGYNMSGTQAVMEWIRDGLTIDKPRYAMGLGRDPQNLIDAVKVGFDMFDCVAPTRLARNGALYSGELNASSTDPMDWKWESEFGAKGRLQIGNSQFKEDKRPIQPGCDCATCQRGYTRAYLNHLYKSDELTYYRLASIHNVRRMVRLTEQLRARILEIHAL